MAVGSANRQNFGDAFGERRQRLAQAAPTVAAQGRCIRRWRRDESTCVWCFQQSAIITAKDWHSR